MACRVSIVIPFLNESLGAVDLLREIEDAVSADIDFILIDDGSTDDTLQRLCDFRVRKNSTRTVLALSRNFGHQGALLAGIAAVPKETSRVVVLDGDFQDRPSDIPDLLSQLEAGFDCAYAVRPANSGSGFTNMLSRIYHILQCRVSSFPIPRFAGTFCAFNSKMLHALQSFSESDAYFPGLRAYVGMKQIGVTVERGARRHGTSRVGFWGLLQLGLGGILSFSPTPVRIIFLVGLIVFGLCTSLGVALLVLRLLGLLPPQGFTTLALLILSLAGLQIMFLGVLGEFLGKTFIEAKRRPRWIVYERIDD